MWALDTGTYAATRDAQDAPTHLRSMNTDPDGRLWGVRTDRIIEFDPAPIERASDEENVEFRLRYRKSHELHSSIPEEWVRYFQCDWRWQEAGSGECELSYDSLSSEQVLGLLTGLLEFEYVRYYQTGSNQFIGIIDSVELKRTLSNDVTIINVGSLVNFYTVIGPRTEGIGGSQCRIVQEVSDALSVDSIGTHEGAPISHNVGEQTDTETEATFRDRVRQDLEKIGQARLREQLRRDFIDEVAFTRAPRVDVIKLYMTDPLGYLDRRYSTPGDSEAISYGGGERYLVNKAPP